MLDLVESGGKRLGRTDTGEMVVLRMGPFGPYLEQWPSENGGCVGIGVGCSRWVCRWGVVVVRAVLETITTAADETRFWRGSIFHKSGDLFRAAPPYSHLSLNHLDFYG